jgi:outer membrane protein OmpA-like peptidoglycan-associated protein
VEVRHEIERRVARLPRNVHFAVRQSILSPASRAVLVRAIPLLLEFPHIHLGLEGHTDRRGTSDYNQALAERRAEAVRAYLVAQGVDPERITVDALGSRVPLGLGANKSEEFALDRRVELHFFGSDDVEIEPVGQTDDLQLEQGPR